MSSYEHALRLADGDEIDVIVHDRLSIECVYDHLVQTGLYNRIRGTRWSTTADKPIREDFLRDLRKAG